MQTSVSRSMRKLALPACVLAAATAAPAASAAPVVADLHVEAGGQALVPGLSYTTDTTTLKTDTRQPACGGTGQAKTLTGPSALGILLDASSSTAKLRPVGVSDKFSFGLLLCGLGSFTASDNAFWLYKVDHLAPEVGGEQFALKNGADVLWYLQDTVANRNTGDELAITVPARARTGRSFTVSVSAYASNGTRKAAAGAQVAFRGGTATTDAAGRAKVTIASRGDARLRATRGADVASSSARVCVAKRLSECAAKPGLRLFGTSKADSLRGSRGRDVISAGAGKDKIDVRGGDSDRVRCGSGRDSVRMSRNDRAARDCEVVIRSGRRIRG